MVTGGAGFIGSHLCERLLELQHQVTCLDAFDPYYPADAKLANTATARRHRGYRLVRGDILDVDLVDRVLAGEGPLEPDGAKSEAEWPDPTSPERPVDTIVHLAALAGVRASAEQPDAYMRVNVEGTAGLLDRARQAGVSHFVFASSSSVYGDNEDAPFTEDAELRPASVYGASKQAGEIVCRAFYDLYGLPVTALRFFTVYGPRQRPDMAIHKFGRLMLEGKPIPVYGDGSSARDYTYVGDIVEGIARSIARPGPYQVYNLGSTRPVRLANLIQTLGVALGTTPRLEHLPDQPGDVPVTWADISRAERDLDYRPTVDIEEGIGRFVRWLRETPHASQGGGGL